MSYHDLWIKPFSLYKQIARRLRVRIVVILLCRVIVTDTYIDKYIGKHIDSSCTVVYNVVYIYIIYTSYGTYLPICHTDLYYIKSQSRRIKRILFAAKILNYYTDISVHRSIWRDCIAYDLLHPYCTMCTIILYFFLRIISETTMAGPS